MPSTSNIKSLQAATEQTDRLKRMMARAHSVSSRTGEELASKWVKNICYYLYKRCADFSPKAEAFGVGGSTSIARAHGFKIAYLKNHQKVSPSPYSDKGKQRQNFTRVADIMRDRGRHRMFIASGWLAVKKIANRSGVRLQTQSLRNGKIVVDFQRGIFTKVRVTISNTSDFARSFHEQHGIVNLALEDERRDLAEYIARKTHADVEEILRTT